MSKFSVQFLLNERGIGDITPNLDNHNRGLQIEPPLAQWDNRREETKIPIERLYLTAEQRSQLETLYSKNDSENIVRKTFTPDVRSQTSALSLISEGGLDWKSREQLETKWCTVWSTSWRGTGNVGNMRRVLLQCSCGYDTNARQKADVKHGKSAMASNSNRSKPAEPWGRRAPYDFCGCLAHLDVTYNDNGGLLKRVMGYLSHNSVCQKSTLSRRPAIPIHPHVIEVAVSQLSEGASVAAVQMKNMEMIAKCRYREQYSVDPAKANFRYEILPEDFTSLYRKVNRINGIDVTYPPERNLDNWLNPHHSHYKPELQQAIWHYTARTERHERLKVCISTSEMDDAAWQFAHKNQIILDGTFGVCTTRLLLFIAMGVDEGSHGIPLAMFLFSAPTGNRATHAGYNTAILAELLETWKVHLNTSRRVQDGTTFCPFTAITDTDTKERAALLQVWPDIILLLCRFHVRQCWTNKRTSLLSERKKSPGEASGQNFWREQIIGRLRVLEKALLSSVQHQSAVELINVETVYLNSLTITTPAAKKYTTGGINYLAYLTATWMDTSMWSSWSQNGRDRAATALQQDVEGIIPTTNHLESFNGVLKRKYIPRWQRSGNRLRFDVFIHHLVLKILPVIFAQRRMNQDYKKWLLKRFGTISADHPNVGTPVTVAAKENRVIMAWYSPDKTREDKGRDLLHAGRITRIESGRPYEIWATCAASQADIRDPSHPRYWLTIHPTGAATCSCPDWIHRGGACKHMHGLRLMIEQLALPFHFCPTYDEALVVYTRNKAWYGPHLDAMVTPLSNALCIAAVLSRNSKDSNVGGSSTPPETMKIKHARHDSVVLVPPQDAALVSSATSLSNHSTLQHLAGDNFNLLEQHADHEDSDAESEPELSNPEEPLPAAHIDQHRGVSIQNEKRLEYSISSVLPVLHGISSILDTPPEFLQFLPEGKVFEFEALLQTISQQLSRLPMRQDNESRPSTSITTVTPRVIASTKGSVNSSKRLLPPSPEAKQKRHKSFGTL